MVTQTMAGCLVQCAFADTVVTLTESVSFVMKDGVVYKAP